MNFESFFFWFRRFDWALLSAVAVIGAAGLLTLSSINETLFFRQAFWYVLFFGVIFAGAAVDWRWLIAQPWFRFGVYGVSVLLVALSNLQPGTVRGTSSWIRIGSFQFEPAELAKVALIFVLAGFFSRRHSTVWLGKNILTSLIYTLIPAFFVLIHPDFGSTIVLVALWFGFLFIGGVHVRRALIVLGAFFVAAILAWFFVLRPYQKERLSAFLFPEHDPLGASYNVNQSKIAIGSAGLFGKGFGLGTQTHLNFLPEAETDFIFAAFVEEWGLVGGVIVLLTFLVIIFRISSIGLLARNNTYRFISLGTTFVLFSHLLLNVGSTVGLTPVTGITFPFLSYGGSHLLTLALLLSIMQRVKIES